LSQIDRAYLPGDEVQINQLYGRITGAYRNEDEYRWQWIDTWNGQANIWLAFEDTRPEDDQLIGQYSLIPTPLSFWGKKVLTGRTENCMSHPDYRGKGMYFFHEKKYFEVAKSLYQVFFTTAGHVAKGAPGKVRHKLGYRPFDYWVTYSLWLDKSEMTKEVYSKLPKILKKWALLGKIVSWIVSSILLWLAATPKNMNSENFKDFGEEQAPLTDIENLWQDNADLYGISVDRSKEYMGWRLKDNPYVSHRFLCTYASGRLIGYIIYTVQDGVVHLVDILGDTKDKAIFRALFDQMRKISISKGYKLMKCHTLSKNEFLIDRLREGKFMNYAGLFANIKRGKDETPMQFFVYAAEELETEMDVWDNQSWYITDLVKEGRPYTARLIG